MRTFVFKSIILWCAAWSSVSWAQSNKLDAAFTSRLHQMASGQATHSARSVDTPSEAMVAASIVFTGNVLEELKSKGVRIRSVMGSVALVNIPLGQISAVASIPGVLRIETPSKPVVRLDKSIPYLGVDKLRTKTSNAGWSGTTGKGVLIGIVDTGIDINHPDFKRADGTTRILRLWNQRSGLSGATPPLGEDGAALYGADCDASAINAALGSAPGLGNACNPGDTGGHGTHVAGIAAGNGSGTGHSQPSGRFVGVAPEADLLVANSLDASADKTQSDPFLDALAWMRRIAQARKQPLVINLSLGSYYGSRDGTGSTEAAIDGISGPGVVVVAAAGNEGNVPIRKELMPMRTGDTVAVDFQIPLGRTSERLEFWGRGSNRYAVQLACPNLPDPTVWTTVARQNDVLDGVCGKVDVTITDVNSLTGDRQ